MTPEGKVKARVRAILREHGAWSFMPVSTGYGSVGVPDIIACWGGKFIAIECKATKAGRPTEMQQATLNAIAGADGAAWVIHAGNVETLPELLAKL